MIPSMVMPSLPAAAMVTTVKQHAGTQGSAQPSNRPAPRLCIPPECSSIFEIAAEMMARVVVCSGGVRAPSIAAAELGREAERERKRQTDRQTEKEGEGGANQKKKRGGGGR